MTLIMYHRWSLTHYSPPPRMAPHDLRRPFKQPPISDRQRRREDSVLRQSQNRSDAQQRARNPLPFKRPPISDQQTRREDSLLRQSHSRSDADAQQRGRYLAASLIPLESSSLNVYPEIRPSKFRIPKASLLRGAKAWKWIGRQFMRPEWMIDAPDDLRKDWYVLARPAGERCFVVSAYGTTVSRLRNGSILHRFPSALPGGARKKGNSAKSYSILDCIFHVPDQTYYVIDMVCWRGNSLYECTAEFRFFLLQSKLDETGACGDPSVHHKFRFKAVPSYNCDQSGFRSAYSEPSDYLKDGLLFYNKHAHYHNGITPLVLIWKDEKCSQYVIDTDNNPQVPDKQHIVLEVQDDRKLVTSDDPPVLIGVFEAESYYNSGLSSGSLIRCAIGDRRLKFVDRGFAELDHIEYIGVSRARAFADSYSKIMFQNMARHAPEDLLQAKDLASD